MKTISNQELLERLDSAFKAITTTDLGGATLVPEQRDRFLRIVQERTVLLGEARRVVMQSKTKNIDRTGFSGRILEAPQAEATEFTGGADPGFEQQKLVATKARGKASLSDETLMENIERDDFEDTLVDLIAEQAAIDLEELYLQGDETSGDTFLALIDGWNVTAANAITGSGTAPDFDATDVEAMFEAQLAAIPKKYLRDVSQWRFYVTWEVENAYRDVLRARGTALGDEAQTGSGALTYKGIPVVVVPMQATGASLLTHPDNTVYGVFKDVEIEPERVASADRNDYHVRVYTDANFEDPNGAVFADGWTG